MSYAQDQLEYLEWKAQFEKEKSLSTTDVREGVYMLVDDASPTESPMFFTSLKSATLYAEGNYPWSKHSEWSVYRVGHQVL